MPGVASINVQGLVSKGQIHVCPPSQEDHGWISSRIFCLPYTKRGCPNFLWYYYYSSYHKYLHRFIIILVGSIHEKGHAVNIEYECDHYPGDCFGEEGILFTTISVISLTSLSLLSSLS